MTADWVEMLPTQKGKKHQKGLYGGSDMPCGCTVGHNGGEIWEEYGLPLSAHRLGQLSCTSQMISYAFLNLHVVWRW